MDISGLRSFATWARVVLSRQVQARITAVLAPGSTTRVKHPAAISALEHAIADTSHDQVIERVAYTWFNRIIALRFMDANGYTSLGVVSPSPTSPGQPEILAHAKRGLTDPDIITPTTHTTVMALLDGTRTSPDPQGEAYALLLAEYCRHYHRIMPFMFQPEGDYTELLLPADLLADTSVLTAAVTTLTPEVCHDVEVIGWLYQFYIAERKDEVFAGFKKNQKAGPAEIPAATQLFTPHWIVRYLVENSIGRLWLLNHPDSALADHMDYYIPPIDPETDHLTINTPEELTVIDPACGSGHMLTYAFDLLYAIYEEQGYAPADIPTQILTHNLHGTEIDPRAGALAAFALTMKARAKQRTYLTRAIQPNIRVIEPVDVETTTDVDAAWTLATQFRDASTRGALIRPDERAAVQLARQMDATTPQETLLTSAIKEAHRGLLAQAEILTRRYRVVIANPPYLGTRHMGEALRDFAAAAYPMTKGDLCTMFLERSVEMLCPHGIAALVTSESWFFNTSFEQTRQLLSSRARLRSAVCIDSKAFGVRLNTVATILEAGGTAGEATFTRVTSDDLREPGVARLPVPDAPVYHLPLERFAQVPGGVYAFDMPEAMLALYANGRVLGDVFETRQGMATTDNGRFVRFWWEVSQRDIGRHHNQANASNPPWVPYNKGGTPVRWWGNQEHVVRWLDDARELREIGAKSLNQPRFFDSSVSWSNIGKGGARFRLYPPGFVFDVAGMSAFAPDEESQLNLLGYLNADVVTQALDVLAPTLNYQVGDVARLPVPDMTHAADADRVRELIALARANWAEQETSHEFTGSPLLAFRDLPLESAVAQYLGQFRVRRDRIAALERESGDYWSSVISVVTGVACPIPRVPDSLPKPTEQEVLEDYVSYTVGCMFGRYDPEQQGPHLANAGESALPAGADADNVIPIVAEDWFEDDIEQRFRDILRSQFGEEHFARNVQYVIETLGVASLKSYFLKIFYRQHWQRYKKRPIYWMFSSPRSTFNALIYVHRYTPSSASSVLNEYLREMRVKLAKALENEERSGSAKAADRLRAMVVELDDYERAVLYPLAAQALRLNLDHGVRANYVRLGPALARIPGLEKEQT